MRRANRYAEPIIMISSCAYIIRVLIFCNELTITGQLLYRRLFRKVCHFGLREKTDICR